MSENSSIDEIVARLNAAKEKLVDAQGEVSRVKTELANALKPLNKLAGDEGALPVSNRAPKKELRKMILDALKDAKERTQKEIATQCGNRQVSTECKALVKEGLIKSNKKDGGKGAKYKITDAGIKAP